MSEWVFFFFMAGAAVGYWCGRRDGVKDGVQKVGVQLAWWFDMANTVTHGASQEMVRQVNAAIAAKQEEK